VVKGREENELRNEREVRGFIPQDGRILPVSPNGVKKGPSETACRGGGGDVIQSTPIARKVKRCFD
jgi:hypothetical protein